MGKPEFNYPFAMGHWSKGGERCAGHSWWGSKPCCLLGSSRQDWTHFTVISKFNVAKTALDLYISTLVFFQVLEGLKKVTVISREDVSFAESRRDALIAIAKYVSHPCFCLIFKSLCRSFSCPFCWELGARVVISYTVTHLECISITQFILDSEYYHTPEYGLQLWWCCQFFYQLTDYLEYILMFAFLMGCNLMSFTEQEKYVFSTILKKLDWGKEIVPFI